MDIFPILHFLSYAAYVAYPVIALIYLMPAYKRLRHRFLANFCISNGIVLYSVIVSVTVPLLPPDVATTNFYILSTNVCGIASVVFGVIGFFQLIRYLRNQPAPQPAPGDGA
jgi:hypothetical protein